MGYPDLMPVSGYSLTPPVIQQQDRSNHHLLTSVLLGGAAAYGARKLNLDIIKDSMSASAFEEAIRSGKRLELKSLTSEERNLLAQARKDAAILSETDINRVFGSADSKTMYDYLRARHGEKIATAQDLENAIARAERNAEKGGSSSTPADKLTHRRDKLGELKSGFGKLSEYERTIADLTARQGALNNEIEELNKQLRKAKGKGDIAKKLQGQIADKKKSLHSVRERLTKVNGEKITFANKLNPLLKPENSNAASIIKNQGASAYDNVKALRDDMAVTNPKEIEEAAKRRTGFLEQYERSIIEEHNGILLKSRQKGGAGLLGMKADLELFKAAEAGDCFVTKSMVQETYQRLGAEVGKGEGSIKNAFEAVAQKLPKNAGDWKRAGILGGVVALGLYCLSDKNA